MGPRTATLSFAVIAAALTAAPVAVEAQATQAPPSQVVATAPAGGGGPSEPDDPKIAQTDAGESDAAPGPGDAADQDAPKHRGVSGEISVGAGTGGYREVEGEATAPIGDSGQVSIAIDTTQDGGRR
jgi:hypothetical protein